MTEKPSVPSDSSGPPEPSDSASPPPESPTPETTPDPAREATPDPARDATSDPARDATPPKKRGSFWRELPILLGVAIVVAILVRAFVLQTFYIPSASMEHTLEINDRVLVNKLIYQFRGPERGEIVVFEAPREWRNPRDGEDFIKRVVAVGGDHVECCDQRQRLLVNGEPLDEPYLYDEDGVSDPAASTQFDLVVPEGRLWVLGDHRSESGDSMANYLSSGEDVHAATVSEDAVIGRAFVLFWPVGRAAWLSAPDTFDSVPDSPSEPPAPAQAD